MKGRRKVLLICAAAMAVGAALVIILDVMITVRSAIWFYPGFVLFHGLGLV